MFSSSTETLCLQFKYFDPGLTFQLLRSRRCSSNIADPPFLPGPTKKQQQTKWDYQSQSWEALRFTCSTFWRHYFQLGRNILFDFVISRNQNLTCVKKSILIHHPPATVLQSKTVMINKFNCYFFDHWLIFLLRLRCKWYVYFHRNFAELDKDESLCICKWRTI